MTNLRDFKTCTIGNLDLILSSVVLMHMKAVEVSGQMIQGTDVRILVRPVSMGLIEFYGH